MAISVTVTSLTKTGSRIDLRLANGTGKTFNDLTEVKDWIGGLDFDQEDLLRLIFLYLLKRSADLSTVTSVVGKTITLDMSKAPNQLFTVA